MAIDPTQQKRFGEIAQAANPQQKDPMQSRNLTGLPTMKKPPLSAIKPMKITDPRRFSALPQPGSFGGTAVPLGGGPQPGSFGGTSVPIETGMTTRGPESNAGYNTLIEQPGTTNTIASNTGQQGSATTDAPTSQTKEGYVAPTPPEQGSINPDAPPPPMPESEAPPAEVPPSGPAGGKGGGQVTDASSFSPGGAAGGKGGGQSPASADKSLDDATPSPDPEGGPAPAGGGAAEPGTGGVGTDPAVDPNTGSGEGIKTGEPGSNIVPAGDIGNTGGGGATYEDTGSYNPDVGGFDPFNPEYNQQAGTTAKVTGHTVDPNAQKRIQEFTNQQLDQWIKAGGRASDFQRFNPERGSFENYAQGPERNAARIAARERFYKQQMDALLRGRKPGVQ